MRVRRVRLLWAAGVAAVAVAAVVASAIATGGGGFHGDLKGYQEVPAVSTGAHGTFTANRAPGGQSIDYRLTYSGLESNATQAHIHFGQKRVNGGISVWLCSNLPSPPTPAGFSRPCPQRRGTVTGTITASDVVGPTGQGIKPTELGELLRAIRRGFAYANVHSADIPGGEIRAQLRLGSGWGN